ncbi:MAG TPA: DNA cytosine methyltransferase, partial [Gammaproteobacteria bacterium]|nr:DNA cytosine methyltransferase [Gammaproteobacteria bacterium]
MRFGTLFSGIGAPEVAWSALGWGPVFAAEVEAFPSAVLAHHYPDLPNLGDITEVDWRDWRNTVDVLIGGSPCQSFSVAGLRGGLDDPRGNLTLELLQAADRIRPEWLVWENVPGVLSHDGGRSFGAIVGALGELGYGWAYRVLDARYFGCAAARKRVFLVGYNGAQTPAAAVIFEREAMAADSPPSAPIQPIYYSHDYNQDRIYSEDGIAPACTAQDSNRGRFMLTNGVIRRP